MKSPQESNTNRLQFGHKHLRKGTNLRRRGGEDFTKEGWNETNEKWEN
jgi:hypothetical protein